MQHKKGSKKEVVICYLSKKVWTMKTSIIRLSAHVSRWSTLQRNFHITYKNMQVISSPDWIQLNTWLKSRYQVKTSSQERPTIWMWCTMCHSKIYQRKSHCR